MTTSPFFTPSSGASASLSGTTLLIPAVSIGSVPQLAIDLLLHHPELKLSKLGTIDPSFCFPFVGPSDGQDVGITTALEVFSNGALTVVQQRSPVFKSVSNQYISALTQWIKESRFKETLWISSIDAAARTDGEFETPVLSLLPPGSTASTPLLMNVVKLFPAFNPPQDRPSKKEEVPVIPGSLLTRKLLQHLAGKEEPNLGALLYFAAEGDTRSDAHQLAQLILTQLPQSPQLTQSLIEPPSWSALFGPAANDLLYA